VTSGLTGHAPWYRPRKHGEKKCLAREEGSSDNEGSQDAPEEGNMRDATHNGQDDT
jgi:hypothetical protein